MLRSYLNSPLEPFYEYCCMFMLVLFVFAIFCTFLHAFVHFLHQFLFAIFLRPCYSFNSLQLPIVQQTSSLPPQTSGPSAPCCREEMMRFAHHFLRSMRSKWSRTSRKIIRSTRRDTKRIRRRSRKS